MKVDYKRQLGMFDPSMYEDKTISIVGLGNIGSHTALALARMGLRRFRLWDFDVIEEHNLSSQAYAIEDIGKKKVRVTAEAMLKLANATIICSDAICYKDEADILVCAVDTLEARRTLAQNLSPQTFVIDGRVGGGQIEVYSQYASDWGKTIPESADDDPCGMRFISYTSYIVAGLIVNQVKRHLKQEKVAPKILFHTDTLQLLTPFMV